MGKEYEIVWLKEHRTFGQLYSYNAHFSVLVYKGSDGDLIEEIMENDDFEYLLEDGSDEE